MPRHADAAACVLQLSRLTTPENGFDGNKLSYSEYCRAQYDRAGNDFGTAATELARNRGSVRAPAARLRLHRRRLAPPDAPPPPRQSTRAVLFVCWMVAQGAGVVADDQARSARSARLGAAAAVA